MTANQLVAASAELETLLNRPVVAYRQLQNAGSDDVHQAERELIRSASRSRKEEFYGGRVCAAACLDALGEAATPVGRGPRNMPIWPQGIVGSIAHCSGYCAAAAARSGDVRALGIDIESVCVVESYLEPLVMTGPETQALGRLKGLERRQLATLYFSAKEAFFKAQFPLTHVFLDFKAVTVEADAGALSFTLNASVPGLAPAGKKYTGRYLTTDQHVFTALMVQN